jgi:hypothetical protein
VSRVVAGRLSLSCNQLIGDPCGIAAPQIEFADRLETLDSYINCPPFSGHSRLPPLLTSSGRFRGFLPRGVPNTYTSSCASSDSCAHAGRSRAILNDFGGRHDFRSFNGARRANCSRCTRPRPKSPLPSYLLWHKFGRHDGRARHHHLPYDHHALADEMRAGVRAAKCLAVKIPAGVVWKCVCGIRRKITLGRSLYLLVTPRAVDSGAIATATVENVRRFLQACTQMSR